MLVTSPEYRGLVRASGACPNAPGGHSQHDVVGWPSDPPARLLPVPTNACQLLVCARAHAGEALSTIRWLMKVQYVPCHVLGVSVKNHSAELLMLVLILIQNHASILYSSSSSFGSVEILVHIYVP
jgi:hypothetical protein